MLRDYPESWNPWTVLGESFETSHRRPRKPLYAIRNGKRVHWTRAVLISDPSCCGRPCDWYANQNERFGISLIDRKTRASAGADLWYRNHVHTDVITYNYKRLFRPHEPLHVQRVSRPVHPETLSCTSTLPLDASINVLYLLLLGEL
jgi:hypothetical protein